MHALLVLALTIHAPAADPLPVEALPPAEVLPPAPEVQVIHPVLDGGPHGLFWRVRGCFLRATGVTSGVAFFYNRKKVPVSNGPTPAYRWAFQPPPVVVDEVPALPALEAPVVIAPAPRPEE